MQGSRGVIWEYELYEDLVYHQDRTFFHSFAGDVSTLACYDKDSLSCAAVSQDCMIGFVFAEESEAAAFYKKVMNRAKHARKQPLPTFTIC